MVIGTKDLNYDIIRTFVNHPEDLPSYSDSLVPIWAQHITAIINNQRYYTAIMVRNMLTIPFKERKLMVDYLIKGITLVGVVTDFVCIEDIIKACNEEELLRVLEEYAKDKTQFKKE